MAMARDGLLPRFFSKIHKKTLVPVNGTLVTGSAAALMSFGMNVDQLAGMVISLKDESLQSAKTSPPSPSPSL